MRDEDRPGQEEETLAVVRAAAEAFVREIAEIETQWPEAGEWLSEERVGLALDRCLRALAATGLWGDANQLPSSELWRIAGPVLKVGWLQNHARTKPRGYAGDHEMLDRIWRQRICDSGDDGGAVSMRLLAPIFDRYFQRQAAPQAVRERYALCAAMIAESCFARGRGAGAFRVASIGSGPAAELDLAARLLGHSRKALRLTLFDLDDEALSAAREKLTTRQVEHLTTVRTNLFRLARRPQEFGGPYEAIVCTGLFDYLEPPAASELMRAMWERLSPSGWMMVGNFSPANPTRAYMEWIGNWYLKYRTREELAAIADAAGIPRGAVEIMTERTGVNLLLRAVKPKSD